MNRNRRMSILPAGMDSRSYNSSTIGKDGALQDWQRNATETLARRLERPYESHTMQMRRPSMPNTLRTVTPDMPEGSDEFHHPNSPASPRSIPGGEKPRERRAGLVFQDSYSTDSLESGRHGPPLSFQSRSRTRTMVDHTRTRSASTNVSRSRHRIGSVHSTNAPLFHTVEPRPALDGSNSLGYPSVAKRPTPPPQLQKSNSVKGRRLVKRSSRPSSPLSTMSDVPSVDSLPFPVATSDANKILMLMKTLCGRMRGEVEYQTVERGPWYPGTCYIDDVKGSLMYEGDDRGPFHLTVVPDLRGCRVQPIISKERQLQCLEISNRSLGVELHLLPMVKAEFDLWLAALLCWQQIRTGTLPASPVAHGERRSRRNSLNSNVNSTASSKDANIIKVAKVLLWDKGAPSSPRAIIRRPSTRDLRSPVHAWRRVSCILQDNGEFKLFTENDVTLLSVIQLSQLSRCAIQRLDKSVLGQEHCLAIFPQYTSTSTQLSIFRPVYIALESRLLYEVWFCLLIAFSIPEIYGPQLSDEGSDYDVPTMPQGHATNDLFRIEKSVNLRIVEAKMRRMNIDTDLGPTVRHSVKPEQDSSIGEYFAEVFLDGDVRARTRTRTETKNPFWREDYVFLDLPFHTPKLSIVVKRLDHIVAHHGFLSSSSVHSQGPGEETIAGTVDVPIDKLERGKASEHWWPILDDQQEQIGEIFLKLRHDELVVLLSKDYEPISLLLHSFSSGLTEQIAQVISTDLRSLSEVLMNIFQVSGHAGDWLMALVEDEIDGVGKETPVRRLRWSRRVGSNESFNSVGDREQTVRDLGKSLQGEANLLFRGNSLFTQAMDFHMRRLGKEYLEDVLSEKIMQINVLNPDCEVDPSRLTHGDDASKNWTLLISLTTEVWDGIATSASRCPGELRQILKYIRAVADDRYGDFLRTVSYTSVSGFLFLRFLCPALLNPKLFGLLPDHPQPKAQRTLTLIAKSLQALANLTTFGSKEQWMEPMNRFLSSRRQSCKDFIDSICSIPSERNTFALPASYSTPITILARLPQTSREGFPSLPYLIDHARNFAALVKLWLNHTQRYIVPYNLEGDLAEFNNLCLDLQRRTDECLSKAQGDRTADRLSLQWEDIVEGLENSSFPDDLDMPPPSQSRNNSVTNIMADDPFLPPSHSHSNSINFHSNATPGLEPPFAPSTVTHTKAPSSAGSEPRDREKRERQSFWESAFRPSGKGGAGGGAGGGGGGGGYDVSELIEASPPSRGQSRNGKQNRSFLSGLRRKGKGESANTSAVGSLEDEREKGESGSKVTAANIGSAGGVNF
ncbi:Inhibitory regulator protein [Lachnellula hyalina]|uniref:Inhibitory regulator protein n=1 Tax=Lachnellula hyalina TaxID=1316788 RepID=A0A8H8R5I8_9HELO|nr:Inhibitory regulator protein [Lachnellula hyalina]TVY28411.1 Inhibitory regulator protein [Lachnellula hyalina]